MATPAEIIKHHDIGPDTPQLLHGPAEVERIEIVEPDPTWPATYERLAATIRSALGERVIELDHVGSTSVPGLPAKPIVDISLAVADPADEAAYVPDLERLGYTLHNREPGWHQHRLMKLADPRVHLHVFGPGCAEVIRHRLFRSWLIEHPDDRARYVAVKRDAAAASNEAGETMMQYNQRKEALIREILDACFRAEGWLPESEPD